MYYFRFSGHLACSDSSSRLGLFKNTELVVTAGDRNTTTNDPEDNISNGVVLQLDGGDTVSVRISGVIWDDQYHRTTFSGFLVFPL